MQFTYMHIWKKFLLLFSPKVKEVAVNATTYHYVLKEDALSQAGNRNISTIEFKKGRLSDMKADADAFYTNQKKRIEYWLMLGSYEMTAKEQSELSIWLVEQSNGLIKEFLIRSANFPIPEENLLKEQAALQDIQSSVP